MNLTVVCVWVKGHVSFTAEYVRKLHQMVQRSVRRPYRFVCLTDRPSLISEIETIRIPSPAGIKGWWSKVNLFRSNIGLSGRILYLDLDTLIVGDLDDIIDYPAPFALAPHAGTFNGKDGLAVVKRFNSSVMVWTYGVNYRLYDDWTPAVAKRLHGDQDWCGEQMPNAAAMKLEWFPRISELGGNPPNPQAKIVLVKTPKNEVAAQMYPWVKEAWA